MNCSLYYVVLFTPLGNQGGVYFSTGIYRKTGLSQDYIQ